MNKNDERDRTKSVGTETTSSAKYGFKITDFFARQQDKTKLTKMEIVEKNFEEEIKDPCGVEQTFVKGLFVRTNIDINCAKLS
jgi:hypothetical protein